MYSIFRILKVTRGTRVSPELNRAISIIRKNVMDVIDYERYRGSVVPGDHPIVRLLYNMPTINTNDPFKVHNFYKSKELEIAAANGIASSVSPAINFEDSIFYGPNVFVLDRASLSYNAINTEALDLFQRASPIQALRTVYNHNPYNAPKLKGGKKTEGLNIFSINIAFLGLLMWRFGEWQKNLPLEQQIDKVRFVSHWVLPNIMTSATDCFITNYAMRIADGEEMVIDKTNTVGYMTEVGRELKESLTYIVDSIPDSASVDQIMESIPLVFKANLGERMVGFNDISGGFNAGIELAATIPMMRLTKTLIAKSSEQRDFNNRLQSVKRMINGTGALGKLPSSIRSMVVQEFKEKID